MAKFLLLARGAGIRPEMSPEEMQRTMLKYKTWTERVAGSGRLADANKLRDGEGRVLRQPGGKLTVTDGPFAESKEIIGGYWLINAASYDEVIEMTRDHPHLQFNTLEIRQIQEM